MVEIAGCERPNPAGELESFRVAELESRRIVERCGFLLDRRHDRFAVVAGIGAPEACTAINQLAPVAGDIMHVLGADDQARALLEGPIGRERHPIGFEVIGDGGGDWSSLCLQHSGDHLKLVTPGTGIHVSFAYSTYTRLSVTSPGMTDM